MLNPSNSSKLSRGQWFLRTSEKAHVWPVNALLIPVIRGKNEALPP